MKLSSLQKFILMECYRTADKMLRGKLIEYYKNKKKKSKKKDQFDAINKSVNKLIDHGLLIGYGKRTAEKWFYTFIKLSPAGKKKARGIYLAKQQKLF